MNGNKLVLDTNAVIDYLNGVDTVVRFIGERVGADLLVSVVTRMELLSYRRLDGDGEAAIRRFLGATTVIPLDGEVEAIAIDLRRKTGGKLPDAIVSASAVWANALLVTTENRMPKLSYPGLQVVKI
jgi:hypothetical protein